MIKWIDINKQKPLNEQKCSIITKDDYLVQATYSSPTTSFIDFDDDWRVYNIEEIVGWIANG